MKHPLGWRICGQRAKHSGLPCKKPAGWGTEHLGTGPCRLHFGNTETGQKIADKQLLEEEMLGLLVEVPDVDPKESLMMCVRIKSAEVSYLSWKIASLSSDTLVSQPTKEQLSANGTVREVKGEQRISMWIGMRDKALKDLAFFSKMARDTGIDEALLDGSKRIGNAIGTLIRGILDDLELTPDQSELAPEIVARHLTIFDNAGISS